VASAVRWPICTAPEPSRKLVVAAAVRASTTAGEGAGHAELEVVLGEPVASVAEPFGLPGQVDAVPQGLGGVRTARDRDPSRTVSGVVVMRASSLSR
jgi:hypothetical protein